jgi:CBS domain containing-hemolysin-like protein
MMEIPGLVLSLLGTFVLSLFHMALDGFSKVSLSGFLEEKVKPYRHEVLRRYNEIRIAVEFLRTIFLIAFLIYLFLAFRTGALWPLWLFLAAVGVYGALFEALPRWIASVAQERLALTFLPSYRLLLNLAAPVVALARWHCSREDAEEDEEDEREAGDEEIATFIDGAKEEGIIEKGEDELLRSVVEFGDTIVREVMTPRVDMVCIRRDATFQKLRNLMITEKYSRIPVYRDRIDNIEGIVIAKDILAFNEKEFDTAPIDRFLRPVIFVPESMDVSDLLREFQKARQKLAVVVDEHGSVVGLVTMEDLMEEIVGEIQDEYDADEARIAELAPGRDYLVPGGTKVEELEDIFEMELAEDDFITASGLVTHNLGRLPTKGEKLEIKGLSVEVLDVDQMRIKKLRMTRPPEPEKKKGK